MKTIGTLALALATMAMLGAPVAAKDKPAKAPNKDQQLGVLVKEINAALTKKDAAAVEAALTRAEGLRGNFDDKKFMPVAKAIAKGFTSTDVKIAMASIEMLGKLKVVGSAKLLGKLASPAAKVKEERIALHVAAIAAAGSIHDPASLKGLEKQILGTQAEIAVAAAEALASYKILDEKPKLALTKRLIAALAKLEKKKSAKDEKVAETATKVVAALNESLGKIAGKEGLSTSAEWNDWLKKRSRSS